MIGSEITLYNGTLLPLLPLSLKGYQNLCRLITTVKLRAKKGEHLATRKDIEDHSEDLICFTGGADGFIRNSLANNTAQSDLAWLNYVFDKRLYIELQRHYLQKEEYVKSGSFGPRSQIPRAVFRQQRCILRQSEGPRAFRRFHLHKKPLHHLQSGKAFVGEQRAT